VVNITWKGPFQDGWRVFVQEGLLEEPSLWVVKTVF
jgi:hypothetical protein